MYSPKLLICTCVRPTHKIHTIQNLGSRTVSSGISAASFLFAATPSKPLSLCKRPLQKPFFAVLDHARVAIRTAVHPSSGVRCIWDTGPPCPLSLSALREGGDLNGVWKGAVCLGAASHSRATLCDARDIRTFVRVKVSEWTACEHVSCENSLGHPWAPEGRRAKAGGGLRKLEQGSFYPRHTARRLERGVDGKW